jgi:uncharacterized protein DUF669
MSGINWDDLKKTRDDVKKLIPDGDQPMLCIESEAIHAKESGNPMLKLKLTIREGEFKGRNLFTNIVVAADNGWALDRLFKNLEAFGIGDEQLALKPSMEQLAAMIKDRNVIATIGHKEWKGEDRNEITELKPDSTTSMMANDFAGGLGDFPNLADSATTDEIEF